MQTGQTKSTVQASGRPSPSRFPGTRTGLVVQSAFLALIVTTPAQAHTDGAPLEPHDFWTTWSLQPSVILPLTAAVVLYARGVHLAWRKAGAGRGVRRWQAAAFCGGVIALMFALIWPLDALGESLFAAHMGQHIALMGVAAPLIVLAHPIAVMMRALPRRWQRRLARLAASSTWRRGWRFSTATSFATVVQLTVFLFWHVPSAIAVSLENDLVHTLMHSSLFASASLFWTSIVDRKQSGSGILALVVTFKFSLIVGALIAFSPLAFYASYATRPLAWGLTLLEDQQLAGLLMMTAGSMMYIVAAVILIGVWLNTLEGPNRANGQNKGIT